MNTKRFSLAFFFGLALQFAFTQYIPNGDAVQTGPGCYRLTTPNTFEGGSVWYANRVNISESFELYFKVFLGCRDTDGADGIAFVLQPISTSIGSAGGGLGYQGISPSFALEIDTWQNQSDPSWDHVAIQSNGNVFHGTINNLAGPVAALPGQGNIEDCVEHDLKISWNADSLIFRAYIDCQLTITYTGDIVRNIFNNNPNVFWGFTGATGGFVNEQRFCLEYISFTESMPDTLICRGNSVQLSAGTGSAYKWSPGTGLNDSTIENPIATPLVTTTYTVEIEDICNNPRYDTIVVQVDTPLTVDLGPDKVICRGEQIILGPTTIYPTANYVWNIGVRAPTTLVGQPGIYQLNVTNVCGTYSDQIRVTLPPLPTVAIDQVSCFQAANGSALAVSRSLGPVRFQWLDNNGNVIQDNTSTLNSDQIQGLAPGSYGVIVTEGNGCSDTLNFQITEPSPLLLQVSNQLNVLCNGDSTGRIALTASGSTGPYSFFLNGQLLTVPAASGLSAGTYQVSVQDANGCDTAFNVTISEPPLLNMQVVEQKGVDCFGNNNGRFTLTATGGQLPYQFAINQNVPTVNNTFPNLAGGSYLLLVQDAFGCIDSLRRDITEPDSLALGVANQQNVLCNGDSSAWVKLQAIGGIPGFQYSIDGVNFGQSDSFPQLPAGNYLAHVIDDSACTASFPIVITEPAALQASIAGILDVDCKGNTTGAVSISVFGGQAPYQYSTAGRPFTLRDTLDSLSVGIYLITVQDSNDCQTTLNAQIDEPALDLDASILSQQQVDCFGNATGAATVTAIGGTAPYTYSINGRDFFTSPTFDSLSARPYLLTVQDSNACLDTVSVQITSPTGLTSQLLNFKDVACHGDSSGSVTILGSGGAQPYQYSFDNINFSPSAVLANLPRGSYQAYLRDLNNCLVSVAFDIYEPPPLADSLIWQKNVDCFMQASAAIRVRGIGGTPPYAYSLDSINFQQASRFVNLTAGNYTLTTVDDTGCVVQRIIQITEPPLLQGNIVAQANARCFGDTAAYVRLQTTGGVSAYQYQLDTLPYGADSLFTGLGAGSYQVVVRDDSACTDTIDVNIIEPPLLDATVGVTKGIACFGDSTGYGIVNVMGGTPGYQYSINTAQFDADSIFLHLTAGNYQVIVQDDSLCIDTVDFVLTESPQLVAQVANTIDIPCHGDQTGGFSLSVSGGIRPYLFSRDGLAFVTDSIFTLLGAGIYDVLVQDDSLCERTFEIVLTEPDTFLVNAVKTDVLCFGEATGTALATGSGGVTPYSFSWNSNPVQDQAQALGLITGTYVVTALDSNLCIATDTVVINEPPLLQIQLDSTGDAYCDWANGFALVSASGGLNDQYRFLWNSDPPQGEPNAENLFGGLYTAIVIDQNGCQDSIEVFIDNTPPATPRFFTQPISPILLSEAEVAFLNRSEGAVAYQWTFGDGVGSGEENPIHTFAEAGEYEVRLTAFNEYFVCPVDTIIQLSVIPDGQLFLANAFSPNNDGYNDRYYVVGEGIVEMEMQIFNRWGRQVAILQSLQEGWNGQLLDGGSAPEGVYTFRIDAIFNDGSSLSRTGTITLIR